MSIKMLFLAVSLSAVLTVVGAYADGQVTEQAAREKAYSVVRSQLKLSPSWFLDVQRKEVLEEELAAIVGGLSGSEFIYKVNQAGDEIRDHVVVNHQVIDADLAYLIVVSPIDGSVYRVRGFPDSMAEFNRLMAALRVKISSPDQAEALADFYRAVNPQHRTMTRISSLLELKQAAEWQCQAVPFDPNERDFQAWWKHAKPLYSGASFSQTAAQSDGGYAVEWIVLSSPGAGLCGGAPLRARLEVGSDGRVGEITFFPLRGTGDNQAADHAHRAHVP